MNDRFEKLVALYEWCQSDLNEQDKEFIEQMKSYLGKFTKIKILEEILSWYKEQSERIVEKDIPDLLAEIGVAEVTLQNGKKVQLQTYYSFKKKEDAVEWLYKNGFGDVVKNDIFVGTGTIPENVLDALEQTGIEYVVKQDIHPMTLKSVLGKYIEEGGSIPQNAFEVNVFSKAKIK